MTKLTMSSLLSVEIETFPFGKYEGEKISAIAYSDPEYVVWWSQNIPQYPIKEQLVLQALDNECSVDRNPTNFGEYYNLWDLEIDNE